MMKTVKVTQIIDPNRFYFCDLTRNDLLQVLRKVESSAQESLTKLSKQTNKEYVPKQFDFVWYFDESSKKFIRCQVDNQVGESQQEIILWALDYGVSLTTTFTSAKLVKIDQLTHESPVVSAGLKQLPAEHHQKSGQFEITIQDEWSKEAVNFFKKCLKDASAVYFKESFKDEDIVFGELLIEKPSGETFDVGKLLQQNNYSTKVDDEDKFIGHFNRTLSSVIDRWTDNADNFIFGEIGENSVKSFPKARYLQKNRIDERIQKEIERERRESVEKVLTWHQRNEVALENLPPPSTEPEPKVPPSFSRPEPRMSAFRYSLSLKDILNNYKSSKSSSSTQPAMQPSSESSSRASIKVIVTPAGAPIDTSEPPKYVDENFELLDEAASLPVPSRNSPSSNGQSKSKNVSDLNKKPEGSTKNRESSKSFQNEKRNNEHSQLSDVDIIENWMELKVGAEYDVFVTNFGSCKSFFVQIVDDTDKWEDLVEMLNSLEMLEPLKAIIVGEMCLVELETGELNRAKIIRRSENSLMCFCVDTAELVYFHNECERVYEIPQEILEVMPFQAINCRLAGINAPSDFSWTNIIYKKVIKRICQQKIKVLKKLDKNHDMIPWGLQSLNSYDVIVFEDAGAERSIINDVLVNYQLADYDHR